MIGGRGSKGRGEREESKAGRRGEKEGRGEVRGAEET